MIHSVSTAIPQKRIAFAIASPSESVRPWTTTSGPVGFALPNSSDTRSPVASVARPKFAPSRKIVATVSCQNAGARRMFTKPAAGVADATIAWRSGSSANARSTSSPARICGERFACFASWSATFEAKSPKSVLRGASNATRGAATSGTSAAAARSKAAATRPRPGSGASAILEFIDASHSRSAVVSPRPSAGAAIAPRRRRSDRIGDGRIAGRPTSDFVPQWWYGSLRAIFAAR